MAAVKESKVRVGLHRAFWATRQDDGKYAAPKEFTWPEECTISNGSGKSETIYAGDAPRYSRTGSGSKELEVQMTKFDRDFLVACCGHVLEAEATGGITDPGEGGGKEFAFGYETTGDQGSIRTWFYLCTSTNPTCAAKTNGESMNEDAESATFTAVRAKCTADGKERLSTTFEPGDAGYDTAFNKVPFQQGA